MDCRRCPHGLVRPRELVRRQNVWVFRPVYHVRRTEGIEVRLLLVPVARRWENPEFAVVELPVGILSEFASSAECAESAS